MTALELYREDRSRKSNAERGSRQEYYTLLRDTLHDELTRDGRSDFLEAMIAECASGKAATVLEFAALRECSAMIVDGQPMQDASNYVPHILRSGSRPLEWQELERGMLFRVNDPDFPQLLRRLKSVSKQMVSMRDQTVLPDADRAAQREIDGLKVLNRTLEKDNVSLRAERDELQARIAQLEEGYISQQLENRLEARRQQTDEELSQQYEEKRQTQENSLRNALLRVAQAEQHKRDAADQLAAERLQERAAEHERLRALMQSELQGMQTRLDEQLQGWQTQICSADYRFLAQSYAALRGEVDRNSTQLVVEAQYTGAAPALLMLLAETQSTLETQMRQMEQALLQLGLQLYQPTPGDPFDENLHSPANAYAGDAPLSQAEITSVETPGVLLDGKVLIRAVVNTRFRG